MDSRPEPTMTQVKIRCREELKARLEAQAKAEKRSVNDVVISRLEDSYREQDTHFAIIRDRFGDDRSFKTICAIASSWELISSVKGTPWHSSPETIDMATSAAAYAISLINSGIPDRLPELENNQAEEMRKNLRQFIGYEAAQLASDVINGREFNASSANSIVSDVEELRKFDIVAWYEAEIRSGRVSDVRPSSEDEKAG